MPKESLIKSKRVSAKRGGPKKNAAENSAMQGDIDSLRRAFETFSDTTARLETAYLKLQGRVSELNIELEKKNRELSLNLSEMDSVKTHLENILESMKMGVIEVDLNGIITIFNRAAEEITGYAREDVLGEPYAGLFLPHGGKTPSALETLRSDHEFRNEEKEMPHAEGISIPVEFSTSIVKSERGDALGVVEIFSDLRSIKKLEEEVAQARTLAALGEMAANVAHEIRNPLGAIGGFAALLERDIPVGDPKRTLLNKIINGVSSLNRIAANLLFYTRPLKARIRSEFIIQVVNDVLSMIEVELAQEKRPVRLVPFLPEEDIEVRIDPDLIQQVLINLMKNAYQAIDGEGEVRVGVGPVAGARKVELYVSDSGKGMDEETRKRLFSPFFTTRADGTGLGLAIVRKIVEFHKGEIILESSPGKGSTFRILLPY